jgi:hypothetical protein
MRNMKGAVLIALALSLGASAQAASRARSDDVESSEPVVRGGGARNWSMLDGRTVGGGDAFHLELGWPGLTVSYLHGMADRLDLGLRLSLNYGYEGYPRLSGIPGVKLQGALRVGLFDAGKLGLALSFQPGILYYSFRGGGSTVGFTLPVALGLNVALSDALNVGASLDVPLWITFGPFSTATVPVLFGVGLEYFLDRGLALTFRMKMGPAINSAAGAELMFSSHIGIAVKL